MLVVLDVVDVDVLDVDVLVVLVVEVDVVVVWAHDTPAVASTTGTTATITVRRIRPPPSPQYVVERTLHVKDYLRW